MLEGLGIFTERENMPLRGNLRLEAPASNIRGIFVADGIPAAEALGDWPAIEMTADEVERIRHGHRIPAEPDSEGWARAITEQGDLVALVECIESEWQPRKVFFIS